MTPFQFLEIINDCTRCQKVVENPFNALCNSCSAELGIDDIKQLAKSERDAQEALWGKYDA